MTRPPFLVCIHDATPAFAQETRSIIAGLRPLVGCRLSLGVVPNWHGKWPLASHRDYCRFIRDNSGELLLHGYFHQRRQGAGLVTWLTGASDEMNGLSPGDTQRVLEEGQRDFIKAFGAQAHGFLAPAWQPGQTRAVSTRATGLDFALGFFSVEAMSGRRVPLSTWMWDCGRWGWLGHVGHGIGKFAHSVSRGVPALAIHPRDIQRGFWPRILRLTEELLEAGYEPVTAAQLLEARDAEVTV